MATNVQLIDPNLLNTNQNMVNGIPQYQDMYIFAELTAIKKHRTVLSTSSAGSTTIQNDGSSSNGMVLNFIGNNQDKSANNPNYLNFTTNWYDGSSGDRTQYEGFGITNIKVVINSSFVPQVNIEFVDIRGLAFFNQNNSPYRILFDFPPPIFNLKLKGYYGMPLEYKLHLVKYTSEFKSENGNFVISAQFIALTYAPLTDVLFRYIINFPLMPLLNNATASIPINPNTKEKPNCTYALILKIKQLYSEYHKNTNNSNDVKIYDGILEQITTIKELILNLADFRNNSYLNNYSGNIKLNIGHTDITTNMFQLTQIQEIYGYDETIKFYSDKGISENIPDRLIICIPAENNSPTNPTSKFITSLNTPTDDTIRNLNDYRKILLNAAASFGVKDSDIPIPTIITGTTQAPIKAIVTYAALDVTRYYTILYKKKFELEDNKRDAANKMNDTINSMIYDKLGMNPTIYNIFKIILDDVDVFFNRLKATAILAENEHKQNFDLIVKNSSYKDTEKQVFAFPLVIKPDQSRTAPTEFTPVFPEITLIKDFINTFIQQTNLGILFNMRMAQNADGTYVWIPISPFDSILGINNYMSPYFSVDTSNGGSLSQQINLSSDPRTIQVIKIILKRFYILTQNSFPYKFYDKKDSGNYITLFSESEAINLIASMFNPQYIMSLKESAKTYMNNPSAFYSYVEANIPALYKFDNTKYPFFNLTDGADIKDDPTATGNAFVNKNNDNYKGLTIYNAPISVQVPADGTPTGAFLNSTPIKKFWQRPNPNSLLTFSNENVFFVKDGNTSGAGGNLGILTETRFLTGPGILDIDPQLNLYPNAKQTPLDYNVTYLKNKAALRSNAGSYNRIELIDIINTNTNGNTAFDIIKPPATSPASSSILESFANIVNLWSDQLANHDTEIYNDIINPLNRNDTLSALVLLSNFGYTLSPFNIYPNKLNELLFDLPAAIEVPSYLPYYMGALVGIVPNDTTYNTIYDFFVTGSGKNLNSTGVLVFADIIDINNQLAKIDKQTVVDEYNTFLGSWYDKIIDQLNILYGDVQVTSTVVNAKTLSEKIEAKRNAYKKYLNSTDGAYFQLILQPLMERYNIINYSQITFKRDADVGATSIIGYRSIYNNNLDTDKKAINDNYFKKFFGSLFSKINAKEVELQKQKDANDSLTGDEDIINQTYYSFKNINDKWLIDPQQNNNSNTNSGYPFPLNTGVNGFQSLIDSFVFVDRGMNPIGNTIINPEILIELMDDPNVSVFTVLTQLLSMNGFEFFPLQNFMNFETKDWDKTFLIDTNGVVSAQPAFVCMYLGGTSNYPTGMGNMGGQFLDDGIISVDTLNSVPQENNSTPDDDNQTARNKNFGFGQVRAFKVKFGEQNQSMFADIKIDSKEYPETNESIQILSRLAGDGAGTAPTPKGQNLYNLYENRSYKATITGLGNMMIQPTQYFQLENVPLFNGAYVILSIEHNVEANKMTTSFSGTKILKYPIPRVLQPSAIVGFQGGNTNGINGNITKGTGAVEISQARLNELKSVFGIDVSKHQGNFDWKTAITEVPKLEFAIIKASQGIHYVDPQANKNAVAALAAGLKIGYYHFADTYTGSDYVGDATAQANHFLATVKNLPKSNFPLVLDIENNDSKHTNWKELDKASNTLWIETFINTLKNSNYNPVIGNITMIYSGLYWLNTYINTSPTINSCPLWLAHWLEPEMNSPTLPKGWTDWAIWQFSSAGRINGYSGDVDLDAMRKTFFDKY